jgi:cell wall-associated NlpC family hydrolase
MNTMELAAIAAFRLAARSGSRWRIGRYLSAMSWKAIGVVVLAGATAACASGGAVRPPAPTPSAPGPATPTTPDRSPGRPGDDALGDRIAADALQFRGIPYRNGGATMAGFDCSGFVYYVLARHGYAVPRVTRDQFTAGKRVSRDQVRAGDLVFFSTVAPGASHVGIALDDEEFVHAPNSQGVVRVERLSTDYWRTRFVGARRVR